MGATLSSETTAAAVGQVGVVRRDPMAMLSFIGYHADEYLRHWLTIGKHADDQAPLPRIFHANWFRRGDDGRFLWPGCGENSRVLAWIVDRLEGNIEAIDTRSDWCRTWVTSTPPAWRSPPKPRAPRFVSTPTNGGTNYPDLGLVCRFRRQTGRPTMDRTGHPAPVVTQPGRGVAPEGLHTPEPGHSPLTALKGEPR